MNYEYVVAKCVSAKGLLIYVHLNTHETINEECYDNLVK